MLSFGGKSSDPPEDADGARYSKGEEPEELDEKTAAFASFASALGIPEAKRAAAREALIQFVKACKSTEYDTEEE